MVRKAILTIAIIPVVCCLMLPTLSHAKASGATTPLDRVISPEASSLAAPGTNDPAGPFPLRTLLQAAYEDNPRIAAARAEWQAAVEKLPQAESLPDPTLSLAYFPAPIETRLGPNRKQFKLHQMIPAVGKLRLQGDRAAKAAEAAQLAYEITVRDVITEVRVSYAELHYLQSALELTQDNKLLVERLLEVAQRDYGTNRALLQDVLRAQSQLAQVTYDLLLLEELRGTEITRINSLLNREAEASVIASAMASIPMHELGLEQLYTTAHNKRQEIKLAAIKKELGEIGLGLAKKVGKPNYTVGFMYNTIGEAVNPSIQEGGRDAWGISASISLPIWGSKNRAAVQEAEYKIEAADATLQDRVNMTNSMIKNLFFKIRTSRRLVELYEKTLLPQAQKSLELSETWYNSGQASFSEMLEIQAVWLNFELARVRSRADLTQHTARLEQLLGVPLPSEGGGDK